uniref:RRM domain-containing protein n=1 Tax=Alexandrium monilatum TaxID=311494 RepID=A0A7S4R3A8_9DINO|mmetsp:Transcript_6762/g.21357  ORF Transcript_6762/g.21357 Transcript_6762/m.21357 type:complete len:468 (+) Transcript_6762:172-1575(+)
MAMTNPEAMLSMAASGMPGGVPPPAADANGPGMPQIDPAMAQAYMQMFQYLQQGLSQQALGTGGMGMPPVPFPGMTPYAPPSMMEPAVNVSVEGMKFQYQLTEDDLLKVFSRYGAVRHIRVDEAGASAVITFHNFQDAQAAMNDLNGKVLNGLEGTLRIQWTGNPSMPPPYPSMPFPGWGFTPPAGSASGWPAGAPAGGGASPAGGPASPAAGSPPPGDKQPHAKGVRKYTCRFLIGIENDKEFQVARRIIGAKGANMKRIVRLTEAKLRLRGMGSGYFEGTGQKESTEPLQLCVSCTSADGYKTAVRQVEELLKRVYEEYRQFCRDSGKLVPELAINLSENQLVYSAARSGAPALTGGGAGEAVGAGLATPKKERGEEGRRSRRSRAKEGRTANGEIDRGEPGPNAPPVEEIERLIDERNEARRANNFPEADRIRELLHSRGVALMDEPGGRGRGAEVTTWRYWRD